MKKSLIIGTITLLNMASASVFASDVGALTSFSAGTPAKAAEVNGNFNAVKSAVDDNDARITTNTAAIATKADAADVTANTTAIATKADAADVTANTAAIATNTAGIATNAAAISTNTGDITNLLAGKTGTSCLGNDSTDIMVRVGPLCVDKYEASVWNSATGGTAIPASTCADNGNDCSATDNTGAANASAIYARSVVATTPAANVTWFQAEQACANSGKRLLTNAEWQMAAAGTPDPGAAGSDTANFCNTNTAGVVATGASTGGTNQCISNTGAFDMVGNLNEWVADWMHGAKSPWAPSTVGTAGTNYGNDTMVGTNPANTQGTNSSNFPAALYRGGAYAGSTGAGVFSLVSDVAPSYKGTNIGFRCAR